MGEPPTVRSPQCVIRQTNGTPSSATSGPRKLPCPTKVERVGEVVRPSGAAVVLIWGVGKADPLASHERFPARSP